MKAVFTGTVADGSLDENDLFGTGGGTSALDGLSVIITALYDPDSATREEYDDENSSYDYSYGGVGYLTSGPFQSILVTINGVTKAVFSGVFGSVYAIDTISSNLSGFTINGYDYLQPDPLGGIFDSLSVILNVESLFGAIPSDLDQPFSLTAVPGGFIGSGNFQFFDFYNPYTAEDIEGYTFAFVSISSVTVESVGAAVVPLPASAFLLFGALGGLGALRLRRKAA